MRVLIVSNLFPPHVLGGYEILCAQVRDALRSRGHEVHVLTSTHGGPVPEGDGVSRILELETPFARPARRSRLRRARVTARNAALARREVERVRPDVVFVWSQLRLSLGAAIAAEASGVPVAYSLNDTHLAGFVPARGGSPRGWAARLLDRAFAGSTLAALRLRRTTCISAALRDDLVEAGVPVAGAQVIHQGLPIERFPAHLDRPPRTGPARVLYAGQLHEYKGVHTLLEAVARLGCGPRRRSLEVSVAGDGPAGYVSRLRALAEASGQPVAFLGRVAHDALPAVYRSHDALVFPSVWREPFGLTHLEAMASGTPVVSTVEGGPREFLEDGENALVFRADDPAALAAQLERLLDDHVLARRLARAGRRCVEERFTLSRYVDDLERFLAEAA